MPARAFVDTQQRESRSPGYPPASEERATRLAELRCRGRLQMDEAPARMMPSERFEEIFRVRASTDGGWMIS